MDILIIGGTKFLGRAFSNEIVDRGHNLTIFHRGKTNPDFLSDQEHILGDREENLELLSNRTWDAVIDTCGYFPRVVRKSAEFLKDKVNSYVFISSISVYKDSEEINRDENADLIEYDDPENEDITATTDAYGGLKVHCENEVKNNFGENSIIIRPGLIVGPYDPTNRFTDWIVRINSYDKIIGPEDGNFPAQYIDARDIAKFTLDLLERNDSGTYNVTGPKDPIMFKQFLGKIINILDKPTEINWVSKDVLSEFEISPWSELTMWLPDSAGKALMQTSIRRALSAGLEFTSLEKTVLDILEWYDAIDGESIDWPNGLDRAKELKILDK